MTDQQQQTVVKSLAGEEVIIFTDAEFAELAGFDPESSSFRISMQLGRSRLAVLKALWRHGQIVDKSGFAVGHLADRVRNFDALDFNTTPVLTAPLMQHCVERVTKGRRTFKLTLVALPQTWLRQIEGSLAEVPISEMIERAVDEVGDSVHPLEPKPVTEQQPDKPEIEQGTAVVSPEPLPPEPVELQVAGAVATALMAQVVEIISKNGSNVLVVKNAQLREEMTQIQRRLGEQTAYVDRLRRELREAGDELTATKLERDGLRQRAQAAEHNLKVATGADAQRLIDAEVHKQVDRIMRQAPGSAKDGAA